MEAKQVIKMVNITKRFGKVTANENVNLTIRQGEIHAILGENGAGKSTLMNMLSGIYCPDSGFIYMGEKEIHFRSPMDAIEQGIGMIHQHFKLVNVFTARENIIAGEKGRFILSPKKLSKQIQEITKEISFDLNLDKKVYNMSVSEKQTVEIVRVLHRGGDILILDEPTAVLTPQETQKLFSILRSMKQRGCAVVIITHKLHEVMEISDQVTVLRKGQTVTTLATANTNPKELTDLMVGKSVDLTIERKAVQKQPPILKVESLTVKNEEKVDVLQNISFTLYGGEILGVAGVAGSGQKELCEAIVGLQPVEDGRILYKEKNITGTSPREHDKRKIRIGFVPEDRLGMGLLPSMDIIDNLILRDYQKEKGIGLRRRPTEAKAQELVERLQIQCPGIYHPIKILSGGNIQKVLLGREIDSAPEILLTAYPVRGLDIGASHTVYDLLNEQKEKGVGVLFVGEDLDVLLALCDRILVLCGGKITGIVDAQQTTKEQLGWMMAGQMSSEERILDALGEGKEEKFLVENH